MNEIPTPRAKQKPARRSNEDRRVETRRALLAAAIDVFSEVGFAAGTTKMIADRANVTRGALQYHFNSKEEMILAVIGHAMERINFSIRADEHLGKSINERVELVVNEYRSAFATPTFLAAIQIFLGVRNAPQLSESMRMHLRQSRDAINKTWVDLFPEAAHNPQELNVLRRITMASIRGYVVIEALGASDFWPIDVLVLRDMLEKRIATIATELDAG